MLGVLAVWTLCHLSQFFCNNNNINDNDDDDYDYDDNSDNDNNNRPDSNLFVYRRVNNDQWKKVRKSFYSVSLKTDAAIQACRTSMMMSPSVSFQQVGEVSVYFPYMLIFKWKDSKLPFSSYDWCLFKYRQGVPRPWKVMEFSKTIFQAWKVMENDCKVIEFL